MIVRIIKDWDWPDIFRQTPKNNGKWENIQFTEDEVNECDYVIVCNHIPKDITLKTYQENIYAITQEPPVWEYKWLRKGFESFSKVFTQDKELSGAKYIQSQPALPWHINKSYDYLKKCGIPEKTKDLSFITSNAKDRAGHRKRMKFLDTVKEKLQFDLFGKGINFIEDKWTGLAPYKYSIAIENHRSKFYWTEKLTDCLLSFTLPIYCGCKNILDFFPKEAMIVIDIDKPFEAVEIIKDAVSRKLWEKRLDAIIYARDLILDKYQFFPYFSNIIRNDMNKKDVKTKKVIFLKELPRMYKGREYYLQHITGRLNKVKKILGIDK